APATVLCTRDKKRKSRPEAAFGAYRVDQALWGAAVLRQVAALHGLVTAMDNSGHRPGGVATQAFGAITCNKMAGGVDRTKTTAEATALPHQQAHGVQPMQQACNQVAIHTLPLKPDNCILISFVACLSSM
ncbi:hypothetical protein, partial [Pseudomonas sp. HMWF032]|uniref:hypothetical protein n=1 Tax=Pseudomonas sp. HMWF032 TaxID=2056866 RepID=UPI001C437FF1